MATETTTPSPASSTETAAGCDGSAMFAKPQKEHEWLQQLVGNWTMESECMGPDGKPSQEKHRGKEQVKSLGGLWIIGEGQGEMPGGGTAQMMITLGFDPQRNRYVGTWQGSMMTHLWLYEGELDPSGRILTLNAEGPSFAGDGKMAKYQDTIELKGPNERTLTSRTQGEDGTWVQFMQATYRRTK